MSQLQPFIKTALLGTQREPLPDLHDGTPLAKLMVSLKDVEPEAALLSVAGAARLSEMAGRLPSLAEMSQPVVPPPTTDIQPCGADARNRLIAILDGRFPALLPEFLAELVQADRRVPDEMLASLLEHGVKAASLRPMIIKVIGATGRWLAAQNRAWTYASPQADSRDALGSVWRAGNAEQRIALLVQVRATHPEWAQSLLQITWKSEHAPLRSKLLRTLESGLSIDDESFLEAALDDRDLSARRTAQDLLAKIPNSRLVQRMTAYAADILRWTPLRLRLISVTFPKTITPHMIRDGVTAGDAPNIRKMQLAAILGAVPLEHWTESWGKSPQKIVQAALASAWPRSMIRGFALAAARQHNAEWAQALMIGDNYSTDTIRLGSILPLSDIERMILKMDHEPLLLDNSVVMRLLYQRNSLWSINIAQRWIDLLAQYISQSDDLKPPGATLRVVIKKFGQYCPVELTDKAASVLMPISKHETVWQSTIQEAIAMLRFRQAMLAEIKKEEL